MSPKSITRKLRDINGKPMPNSITHSPTDVADTIAVTLRQCMSSLRLGVKHASRLIGTNERTINNLIEARNLPSTMTLLRLCAEFDDVFEEFCRLAGRIPPHEKQAQAEQLLEEFTKRLQDHKRGIINAGSLPPA